MGKAGPLDSVHLFGDFDMIIRFRNYSLIEVKQQMKVCCKTMILLKFSIIS